MDSDGDKYAAGNSSSLGSQDPYGYSYTAPNPFSGLSQINPNAVSPMFGVAGVPSIASGPEYLQYDIRGRGGIERTFFNCGTMYLIGITTGGAIGLMEGLRSSPSSKFKIRLNTVLNKCGRRGSRFGNALGSLAMLYSIFESISEKAEADRYLGGYEIVNPVLASVAAGLVYKSTHGPKTMLLAGLLGGTFVLGVTGVKQLLPRPYNAPSGLLFF